MRIPESTVFICINLKHLTQMLDFSIHVEEFEILYNTAEQELKHGPGV